MDYTIIEVPDLNDSVSRIVLNSKVYYIRFTYNDTGDYWKFGIYTAQHEPIIIGMKIVPRFPINIFYGTAKMPIGTFMVRTQLDRIGRKDFTNGKAKFCFFPIIFDP